MGARLRTPTAPRVRLWRNSRGRYGFNHEVRDDASKGAWRLVNSRGHSDAWDYDEALHRAETYAGLVGARVVIPAALREQAVTS